MNGGLWKPRCSLQRFRTFTTSLTAVVLLAVALLGSPGPSPAAGGGEPNTGQASEAAGGEWPQFRGNPSHTGYTNATVPDDPALRWVFEVPLSGYENFSSIQGAGCGAQDGYFYVGSPIVSNDIVIFYALGWPCHWIRAVAPPEAILRLYALNATTGKPLWNQSFEIYQRHISNPVIVDNRVVITAGSLYGLNVYSGKIEWQSDIRGYPNLLSFSNEIIFTAPHNHIEAFNGDGTPLWNLSDEDIWYRPPVKYGNDLLIPVQISENQTELLLVNNTTGEIINEYLMEVKLDSYPVIFNDHLFGLNTDYYQMKQRLFSYDLNLKQIKWSTIFSNTNYPNPRFTHYNPDLLNIALDKNKKIIIVNGIDGIVRGINMDGSIIWTYSISESEVPITSPSLSKDRVLFGGNEGQIYMLNSSNGKEVWTHAFIISKRKDTSFEDDYTIFNYYRAIETSAAIIQDWFYIGTKDGKIYAFGPSIEINDEVLVSSLIIGLFAIGSLILLAIISTYIHFNKIEVGDETRGKV